MHVCALSQDADTLIHHIIVTSVCSLSRYLIQNLDWLEEKLGDYDDDYILFDCPGEGAPTIIDITNHFFCGWECTQSCLCDLLSKPQATLSLLMAPQS